MNSDDVAIIIPVYNEAKVIRGVIAQVSKHFENIVCIDDGSEDSSAREIEQTNAQLVSHPINMGQGAAIQTGIEYALLDENVKYFVTFDADGQHQISDVNAMLEVLKKGKFDIVLGSRFLGSVENVTTFKRMILKLAVIFSNQTSGLNLTDAHNGLRAFNRKVAEQLDITMADFSHASEIIERIAQKRFRYTEVPVTIKYTEYSKKKGQSVINAVNIGFDVLLNKITKR